MRLHDQIFSEEDFEQLPQALQRKYFSSLERLRLAQDASSRSSAISRSLSQAAKRPSTSHQLSSSLSIRKPSVSSAGSTDRSFSVASLPRERTKSRLRKASQQPISPSTTLINPWDFVALPAAVQRKHFSPEEQYYIASRLNLVILDAADEALYKQYQQRKASTSTRSLDLDRDNVQYEVSVEEEDEEDMDLRDMESFRWLDQDPDLDLKLDDYHAISTDINSSKSTVMPNRRSFRRGLSFSNVSFRRRSSSSNSLQLPSPSGANLNKSLPSIGANMPRPGHESHSSMATIDPSTTHYQDPTAKMKLRVYLASPQKFDEALEFGFPSLHKDRAGSPTRPKTSPGVVNGQPKTFFADDTPSLSEDDGRDERSDYLQDSHSPRTPIEMSFPNRSSQKSSTDRSAQLRPRIVHNPSDAYAHVPALDREMTLKMTLTRPELRALEQTDHVQAPLVNELPLEKPSLMAPVDQTRSIWDELPEEPSRVKRFFKKFKGRS